MLKIFTQYCSLCICILMFTVSALASETKSSCLSCEAVQHAAELSEIEKYLQKSDMQSVEQLDEEAKEWFATFQEGGMLFDGWKDISDKVVATVPENEKLQTKLLMLALGIRMGCEWSKDNDIRKISTKMLKSWGKEIREVVDNSPEKIPYVLKRIEWEVDELLITVQ